MVCCAEMVPARPASAPEKANAAHALLVGANAHQGAAEAGAEKQSRDDVGEGGHDNGEDREAQGIVEIDANGREA
jgi:hypothetical protein